MSLIDNLKGGTAKPAVAALPQAPGIAKRLETAKAELGAREAEHGDAALAEVLGEPGAADRLRKLTADIGAARNEVAKLESAHRAAVARDDAALRAHRAQLAKSQCNALRQHLAARDAAAVALSAALGEAAKQYHILIERSEKAAHTAQAAGFDFAGAECEHDPLVRLVRCEMHRLSASVGDLPHDMDGPRGHALPGTALPGMEYQHRPADIPALPDKLKAASASVLARITGKAE